MVLNSPPVPLPKPCLCPACGTMLEASTPLMDAETGQEGTPSAGDCTMCLGCGTVLVYTAEIKVRVADPADLARLPSDLIVALFAAQLAQRAVRARFPREPEAKN